MKWTKKDLLGLEELSREEIELILETAFSFKEVSSRDVKKVPTLRGKTIVNLFFEPSTRTRTSFELAAKRLSADILDFSISDSSVSKGESPVDTAENIEAMKVDCFVVRHSVAGVPKLIAKKIKAAVINAGDNSHEHPTQALLDLFTIREKKGKIKGLRIAIIGDIQHSRVARSNIWGLTKLGASVILCGPPTLIPSRIGKMGAEITYSFKEAIKDADILYFLRVQRERQQEIFFPSIQEYAHLYGANSENLKGVKKNVLIMHPGPINRGVEIKSEIADSSSSLILEQVTNGIAVRMAVLYLLIGKKD
ncbi:MAG: aspartate carbamoyltransferase [bacterium (Candidatus Ratteibacteria) CG_4_10_14_3_um_filter_41_18]|uniref:Aspartate carbamoyltransferase n=3 Tax=Candidatus Ratteibacteria TaxID=2979319 RepID=A0A2M7YDX8_9BACT|nr:MAG: aspartate carbamoyltransferase [Candidatus Omnitrophica bacterium CG1_02_41_171]PIV64629.1 MAG: aspartate carbamoyltransferase [bacterium (Candidatus Ratteibacteria) CG01_land_8_20_14_3_00_40_19]PIW74486.1 MAG: aspartate carbamoyltransferase [bacterium (Candidatus Ratteibacteria) CG_4_8_14_3_um_filter_41_36]PIX77670.1 MAG: aspartate carbamoyltransferase [bacterium (Candidatus Ratteibacteria) CG_4_10_14_3_um_filter_41_18]PJA61191.1 MAG: aspartate carbamoyltransferase [bacterium (Candidat